ncbi:MAG: hypothetical protein Q8M76_17230 [Spirochaetaceae bacterium]|nr:hypothetical protein [Spirochaetaceae bacterium]
MIGVAEELEYVRSYVAIQEVRYRDGFSWSLDADADALEARVCRFSVQPLVENCFTHGVHQGSDGMCLTVSAQLSGAKVLVDVLDDGPGCSPGIAQSLRQSFAGTRDRLGREGGLFNVHDRIRMTFGYPYGLGLLDVERGFGIRLSVPRVEARPGEER